jgi:hypothetical protein
MIRFNTPIQGNQKPVPSLSGYPQLPSWFSPAGPQLTASVAGVGMEALP